jgi:hypothetical protein
LSSSDSTPVVGQSITLTATVSGVNPSGLVTFKDGGTTLGTGSVSAGKATLNTSFSTATTHSVTASYDGDANNATSDSTAVSHAVSKASTATGLSSSDSTPVVGQSVTLIKVTSTHYPFNCL